MATVVLSCLHTLDLTPPPRQNDMMYCFRCEAYKRQTTIAHDYAVSCDSCKTWAHREYGRAIVTAETRAVKHSISKPGHRVSLLEDDIKIREFYRESLTLDVDVPGF